MTHEFDYDLITLGAGSVAKAGDDLIKGLKEK